MRRRPGRHDGYSGRNPVIFGGDRHPVGLSTRALTSLRTPDGRAVWGYGPKRAATQLLGDRVQSHQTREISPIVVSEDDLRTIHPFHIGRVRFRHTYVGAAVPDVRRCDGRIIPQRRDVRDPGPRPGPHQLVESSRYTPTVVSTIRVRPITSRCQRQQERGPSAASTGAVQHAGFVGYYKSYPTRDDNYLIYFWRSLERPCNGRIRMGDTWTNTTMIEMVVG